MVPITSNGRAIRLPKYELALFEGVGGGILGGKLLGWRTVCAVEIEPYCRGVLAARQNNRILDLFPVWDTVETFRADNPDCHEHFEALRGISEDLVISGGLPCQDISCAERGPEFRQRIAAIGNGQVPICAAVAFLRLQANQPDDSNGASQERIEHHPVGNPAMANI